MKINQEWSSNLSNLEKVGGNLTMTFLCIFRPIRVVTPIQSYKFNKIPSFVCFTVSQFCLIFSHFSFFHCNWHWMSIILMNNLIQFLSQFVQLTCCQRCSVWTFDFCNGLDTLYLFLTPLFNLDGKILWTKNRQIFSRCDFTWKLYTSGRYSLTCRKRSQSKK